MAKGCPGRDGCLTCWRDHCARVAGQFSTQRQRAARAPPPRSRSLRRLQDIKLAQELLAEGQEQLFEAWPPAGQQDEEKRQMLEQVCVARRCGRSAVGSGGRGWSQAGLSQAGALTPAL